MPKPIALNRSLLGDGSIIGIEWAVWVLLGMPHTQLHIVSNTTAVPSVSAVVTLGTERLLSTQQLRYVSFKEKFIEVGDSNQL
jgi:hypothetical protein